MGYGSRALKALNSYFSGEYVSLDEGDGQEESYPDPSFVDPVSIS
jgi:N-acetyltransferase 10